MKIKNKLNNKKIMISVILVVLAAILFIVSFYIQPEEKCGYHAAGIGYDESYCDKSCNSIDDCKFVCGCGAINKNEICSSPGVEVDCAEPSRIKCISGECISFTEQQVCENQGGEWKQFNNGCMDSCEYRRNPTNVMCTQALTFGCECGPDRCWNAGEKVCEEVEKE